MQLEAGLAGSLPVLALPAPTGRLEEAVTLAAHAWDVPPRSMSALVEDYSDRKRHRVWIALDPLAPEGAITGVATATLLGGAIATSDDTVIAEKARGRGLGAALLDALITDLRAAGVREVRGQSSEKRARELRFFLRYGFTVVDIERALGVPWFEDGELIFHTRLLL